MLVNNQLLIYNISKNNLFLFFMNKQIILKSDYFVRNKINNLRK